MTQIFDPIHPGEILREEFLEPLKMSASALSRAMLVNRQRISQILNEKRDISADTALRLGRVLNTGPEFWMNLQSHYDLESARNKDWDALKTSLTPIQTPTQTGQSDEVFA